MVKYDLDTFVIFVLNLFSVVFDVKHPMIGFCFLHVLFYTLLPITTIYRKEVYFVFISYVVKSVYYGNTVVMCFPFLSPASWLVSALRTTMEMRIKQSSSAWSPRSCTISHTAQTASPVKRPRWGWQNPFTVSGALFPRARTGIVTYAHIVRKYPTALLFGWSHVITVLNELINQIKCVHAWVFCFHACRAHWGCGNIFFSVFLGEASFTYHLSW